MLGASAHTPVLLTYLFIIWVGVQCSLFIVHHSLTSYSVKFINKISVTVCHQFHATAQKVKSGQAAQDEEPPRKEYVHAEYLRFLDDVGSGYFGEERDPKL